MKLYCKNCKSEDVEYELRITKNDIFVCLELSCNHCFELEIVRIVKPANFSVDIRRDKLLWD